MIVGIHYLDGTPEIDDWFGVLTGIFFAVIILIIASIILAVVIAAFLLKSNKTPTKEQIRVLIPISTISLMSLSLFAFIISRPSYTKSNAADSVSCQTVKEGYFLLDNYIIKRQENIQTETDRITKDSSTSRVNWISECEYELINITDSTDVTRVKIISVTKAVYKCISMKSGRTTTHELTIKQNGN